MATPKVPTEELNRRREAVEQCLREGYAPLGEGGAKSAVQEAARRLDMSSATLGEAIRKGRITPDWSLYRRAVRVPFVRDEDAEEPPLSEQYGAAPAPAFCAGPVFDYYSRPDNTFVFGAVGDNHAGSLYERPDVLEDLYDRFERAKVDRVFHTGNWIDGECRFNKHDLRVHGMDRQVRHLAETYPQREGIETYAIHGDDHEGWYGQREGVDIGRYCEHRFRDVGRTDWHDLGFMEAHVRLINAGTGRWRMMHVVHPGGGSAYALSYAIQKIIESLEGGEKPAVGLYGHYHKLWSGLIRNVWCIQTGCAQDQTPFMRKKRLEAHVGGVLVRLEQNPEDGSIVACTPQLIRYFNRGYYGGRWSRTGSVVLPERGVGA